MKHTIAQKITILIVWIDLVINYTLGLFLLFLPYAFDRMIGSLPVLSPFLYQVIGGGLIVFAGWQSYMVSKKLLFTIQYLWTAITLAILPVIILTTALLFGDFSIKTTWMIIIWLGDLYMVLLTAWYFKALSVFSGIKK